MRCERSAPARPSTAIPASQRSSAVVSRLRRLGESYQLWVIGDQKAGLEKRTTGIGSRAKTQRRCHDPSVTRTGMQKPHARRNRFAPVGMTGLGIVCFWGRLFVGAEAPTP